MIARVAWTAVLAVALRQWWIRVGDDLYVDMQIRYLIRRADRQRLKEARW